MTFQSAMTFALALSLWVLIPGPAILAVVGRSLSSGLKSVSKLIVGILLGDLFYITIALIGMATIGKTLGTLFFAVRMVGACYLIFLGLRLWFTNPEWYDRDPSDEKPDRYKTFLTGFSITLGNPKAILFHFGFLPTFFNLSAITVVDAFLIIMIFIAVLGSSLTIYAYTASKARLFFKDQKRIKVLNRSAGTLLIGAGIAVAAKK